jgi:hypothetical protein
MGLFRRKSLSATGASRSDAIDHEIAALQAEIAEMESSANRYWTRLDELEHVRKAGNKSAVFSAPSKYDAELERRIRDASYGGLSYEQRLEADIKSAATAAAEAQSEVEQRKARVSALRKERRALK